MTTLSLIIPATDEPATLERAVAAVHRAAHPPEELIVVDRPRNLGPAAARNVGARQATGDVLVFVDADVEVHADAFVRIRQTLDGDTTLAAVFGSYDDEPAAGGMIADFRNLLHHHVHHEGAGVATTFWAGVGAIRRDVFLELGGFDEYRFPNASVEDIELGMRLHAQGRRIRLDPAIQGKHLKHWTLVTMTKTDLLRRGLPWLRLVLEDRHSSMPLNLGWPNRVGTLASLLLVGGLLRRNVAVVGGSLAVVIAVDRKFHQLLFRHGGVRMVAAGMPLHVVHRLIAAVAVPIAVTDHLLRQIRTTSTR